MSYYPQPDINICRKVKVVLDLINYATGNIFIDATGVDISKLVFKSDFFALKPEFHKLYINKFVDDLNGFSNLKAIADDLETDKLKAVSIDLKYLNDAVREEVVKN